MKAIADNLRAYWPMIALFLGVIFSSGGAWSSLATVQSELRDIKPKVDKIAVMEEKISNMGGDVSSIENNVNEMRKIMESAILNKFQVK